MAVDQLLKPVVAIPTAHKRKAAFSGLDLLTDQAPAAPITHHRLARLHEKKERRSQRETAAPWGWPAPDLMKCRDMLGRRIRIGGFLWRLLAVRQTKSHLAGHFAFK